MSYRVNVTFRPSKDPEKAPWMDPADVLRILDTNEKDLFLPETNFVELAREEAVRLTRAKTACVSCKAPNDSDARFCKKCGKEVPLRESGKVLLKKLWWCGNHAEESLKRVAPFVRGRFGAIFVGEDGEVFGGLLVDEGVCRPCKVEMTLVPHP